MPRQRARGLYESSAERFIEGVMNTVRQRTGIDLRNEQKAIEAGITFRQWCEKLAKEGLKVDGRPFTLDDRPAMAWIYDQVPSTEDEAFRLILVLMKCAQVGFTVMEMLATIYMGLRFGPSTVGMFLPDMNLAGIKSTERFVPIVRSVPSVHALMTQESTDGKGRKKGEGNVNRRRIANALFIFSWTSGRATTESVPMDILSFDEVQEMLLEQMEKTLERLSASSVRFTLMGSTANWPDSDIHFWFKRGSQHQFHTRCPSCGAEKPMDEYFPNNIKWDTLLGRHRYVCEAGHWIDDPQIGEWKAVRPEADPPVDVSVPKRDRPLRIRSIHFPQFLSPTISAGEIMDAYMTNSSPKNFYNRKLGKPFLDPSLVPVNLSHLAKCVEAGREAGVTWKTHSTGAFMGIDQMGNYNVVVIKERLPDGRQAVIHVEEIYSDDPFMRCSELMKAYGVFACAVEINPNYNDAKRFANRHRGRVFIGNSFGALEEDMVRWGDAPKLNVSERRTDEEERDRFTFRMDQYKCMQVSMARFTAKEPLCLFPDPKALLQEVVEKGVKSMVEVLPRVFHHFTKTALVAEKDELTNKYKRVVQKIGIDPHFSYANMLCDVAWARAHGTATFILPTIRDEAQKSPARVMAEETMPGLPKAVIGMMDAPLSGEKCGRCIGYESERTWCKERNIQVQPNDPGCPFFIAVED